MSTARLPPEILNIIVCLSSFTARARIVCLNRWFHQAFGNTLYRDIHIRSALQLVKLFRSPKVARNLVETRRLAIERSALWTASWDGIRGRLKPAEYLGRVLQMTTSLCELNIEKTPSSGTLKMPDWEFEHLFLSEIRQRASNPSFLPHLARIQSSMTESILSLCQGRPIEYLLNSRESGRPVHQAGAYFHPIGVSPMRVSLNTSVFTGFKSLESNAHDIAKLLEDVSLRGITIKHLKVVVINSVILFPNRSQVDLPPWVMAVSSKSGYEHLESLCIIFEPPLTRTLVDVQLRVLEQAIYQMPNLTYARLGSPDVEWRRHPKEQSGLPSRIPDWTPCPAHRDLKVLSWWLGTLGSCNAAKAMKGDLEGVGQLRNSMLTRWDEALVPSIEVLRTRLSHVDPSSVQAQSNVCARRGGILAEAL